MGHPKKKRKKFSKPIHPWETNRIEKERKLMKGYGFKNKKEIWKMQSKLRKFTKQAKNLANLATLQAEKEKKQLLNKLYKLNLLNKNANLGDVLTLKLDDIANRRLQTLVFKRGFARSIKQARQFIVHGHVFVGNRKVTFPSYIVNQDEENIIEFDKTSSLSSQEHPERLKPEEKKKTKKASKKEVKKKSAKKEKKVKRKEKPAKKTKKVKQNEKY